MQAKREYSEFKIFNFTGYKSLENLEALIQVRLKGFYNNVINVR